MKAEQIKEFAIQIDLISKKYEKIIITGDVNLCNNKSPAPAFTEQQL